MNKKQRKSKDKTKKVGIFANFKSFLKDTTKLIVRIKDNHLLNNYTFTRIVVILFFFGLNIVLLPYFFKTNSVRLPREITVFFEKKGWIEEDDLHFFAELQSDAEQQPSLEPKILLEKLNKERELNELKNLSLNEKLIEVAIELLEISKEYDYDISKVDLSEEFKEALNNAEYDYLYVSHNMLVGPMLEQAVIDAWYSDDRQIAALQSDEFVEVGFATEIVDFQEHGTLGVVVQVLGVSESVQPASAEETIQPLISPFVDVSDKEVFEALNLYRGSYNVLPLEIHPNLCSYAEKRVGDLVVNGGLDNHDGFRKDFDNLENLPDSIKNYPGNKIAENLAYQHCRNMKTDESFYANTGIAIIEWCFDSSTQGHKEAQLNREFRNVCIKHDENMYVVIFGE